MAAATLFLIAALGAVQLGSDAIFAGVGAAFSLPARLHPQLGVRIYREIARVAPAPYVNAMLARAAYDSGDLALARQYVLRLPPSSKRSDELGRIALQQGNEPQALHDFILAGDSDTIDAEVAAIRKTDLPRAYALESSLKDRLEASTTHPDALAQAYWRLGTLAIAQGRPELALRNYEQAVTISPLSEKYLLWAGYQAYDLRRLKSAAQCFARAIAADPTSADAYAGAGLVLLSNGQRAAAQANEVRARALDPHAVGLARLEAALR